MKQFVENGDGSLSEIYYVYESQAKWYNPLTWFKPLEKVKKVEIKHNDVEIIVNKV